MQLKVALSPCTIIHTLSLLLTAELGFTKVVRNTLLQSPQRENFGFKMFLTPLPLLVHFLVVSAQVIVIPSFVVADGAVILSLGLFSLCCFVRHDWSLKIKSFNFRDGVGEVDEGG